MYILVWLDECWLMCNASLFGRFLNKAVPNSNHSYPVRQKTKKQTLFRPWRMSPETESEAVIVIFLEHLWQQSRWLSGHFSLNGQNFFSAQEPGRFGFHPRLDTVNPLRRTVGTSQKVWENVKCLLSPSYWEFAREWWMGRATQRCRV